MRFFKPPKNPPVPRTRPATRKLPGLLLFFAALTALPGLQQRVLSFPTPAPDQGLDKIGPDPTPCPPKLRAALGRAYYYDVEGRKGLNGGLPLRLSFVYRDQLLPADPDFTIPCNEVGALYGYRVDPPPSAPDLFQPFYGYVVCRDCCEPDSCLESVLIPVDGEAARMPLPTSSTTRADVLQVLVLNTYIADSLSVPSRVMRLGDYSTVLKSGEDRLLANLSSPERLSFSWTIGDLDSPQSNSYIDPGVVFLRRGSSYSSGPYARIIELDSLPAKLDLSYGLSEDAMTSISIPVTSNRSVPFPVPIAAPPTLLASELNPLPALALPRDAYILETSMEALLAGEATATPDLYRQMDLNGDDAVTTCDLLLLRGESCPTPTPTPSPTPVPRPEGWLFSSR